MCSKPHQYLISGYIWQITAHSILFTCKWNTYKGPIQLIKGSISPAKKWLQLLPCDWEVVPASTWLDFTLGGYIWLIITNPECERISWMPFCKNCHWTVQNPTAVLQISFKVWILQVWPFEWLNYITNIFFHLLGLKCIRTSKKTGGITLRHVFI